jgi:hypothetical protein
MELHMRMTAVGHLAKHGYVTWLRKSSQEQVILLTPSRLIGTTIHASRKIVQTLN